MRLIRTSAPINTAGICASFKGWLESKDVKFPDERLAVSEEVMRGLPPNVRVDPATGGLLDSASTKKTSRKKGSGPDILSMNSKLVMGK